MKLIYVVQYHTNGGCWVNCPDGYYENRNSANYHIVEAEDSEFPDCVCSSASARVQEIGVHV